MEYELELRSARYPADIRNCTNETIPGKPLADDIAAGLRALGYREIAVVNESPLWVVEVGPRRNKLEVTVYASEVHDVPDKALWSASVPSRRGLWARLIGEPEDAETFKLAKALEKAVRAIDGVKVVGRKGDWDKG